MCAGCVFDNKHFHRFKSENQYSAYTQTCECDSLMNEVVVQMLFFDIIQPHLHPKLFHIEPPASTGSDAFNSSLCSTSYYYDYEIISNKYQIHSFDYNYF